MHSTENPVEHVAELKLHGIDYAISVSTRDSNAGEILVIQVEEKLTGEKWKGTFPATCK